MAPTILPEAINWTPKPSETHDSFARFLRERVGLTHITAEDTCAFLKWHPLWQGSAERHEERRVLQAKADEEKAEAEKVKAEKAKEKAAEKAKADAAKAEKAAKSTKTEAKADDSDLSAADAEPDDEATPAPARKRTRPGTPAAPSAVREAGTSEPNF